MGTIWLQAILSWVLSNCNNKPIASMGIICRSQALMPPKRTTCWFWCIVGQTVTCRRIYHILYHFQEHIRLSQSSSFLLDCVPGCQDSVISKFIVLYMFSPFPINQYRCLFTGSPFLPDTSIHNKVVPNVLHPLQFHLCFTHGCDVYFSLFYTLDNSISFVFIPLMLQVAQLLYSQYLMLVLRIHTILNNPTSETSMALPNNEGFT